MNFKKIATISVALNVTLVLAGGYFIYSNEGISDIKDKVPSDHREVEVPTEPTVKGTEVSASVSDNNDKKRTFTPLHKVRESVFNSAVSVGTGVVFLGDSLTDYNEWGEVFPHVKTYNRGISGDTTIDVTYRLNQVMALKPSKVFLMVGINDLRAKTPKEKVVENYKNIVKQLKIDLPDTKVFIESILPVRVSKPSNLKNEDVDWINKELEKIANENEYKFINLHPLFIDNDGQLKEAWTVDGVHINSEGYKAWENEIKNDVYR